MARKTKAELVAENEAFMAQRLAEEVAAFPALLMAQLERATNSPNWFELRVRDSQFVLIEDRETWKLPMVHSMEAQIVLDSLMWDLDQLDEDRRVAAEREEMRQTALSKLTDFERKLLNL